MPGQTKQKRPHSQKKGLVIVNTGEGKGKTTAALGMLLRAWGRGMRVGMIQFFKHENARFGEKLAAEKIGIEVIATGDGFTWKSKDIDETKARSLHGWELAKERITSGAYDVLALDEFTYVLDFGWLDVEDVLAWLREHKPAMLHLIITGRDAPEALIEYADLVTEMTKIKHPYDGGEIGAQAGIEF